jgi:hypothetical protein
LADEDPPVEGTSSGAMTVADVISLRRSKAAGDAERRRLALDAGGAREETRNLRDVSDASRTVPARALRAV